jgi:hypothetical protein
VGFKYQKGLSFKSIKNKKDFLESSNMGSIAQNGKGYKKYNLIIFPFPMPVLADRHFASLP